ncbi:MAG: FHA domain-containing protein [Christensenellales bacterium]|jgi:hypothetical protein
MKQCEKGHFYDEGRFSSCPYCETAPVAAVQPSLAASSVGKTVAVASGPIGKTVAVNNAGPDRGKTVAIMKEKIGLDPAVGFLVCVKGPHRGKDYRLMAGRNALGRSGDADISLPDDPTVSREKHAIITYDERNNQFVLSPGTGRGVTYLNDQLVEAARDISAYDRIELGATVLVFLPLCGPRFNWSDHPEE